MENLTAPRRELIYTMLVYVGAQKVDEQQVAFTGETPSGKNYRFQGVETGERVCVPRLLFPTAKTRSFGTIITTEFI